MSEKVSLGGALKAAYGFWGRGVRATAGILALATLAQAWLQYLSGLVQGGQLVDRSLHSLAYSAASFIAFFASIALYRAFYAEAHPEEPEYKVGPLGFQIGRPEASAFISSLLLTGLMVMLALALFVGLIAAFTAVGASSGDKAPKTSTELLTFMGSMWPPSVRWRPVMAYLAGAGLLATWISTRLALVTAASVAERRVRVLSTWMLTKGIFWKMLIGQIIILAPALAMSAFQQFWLEPTLSALHLGAFAKDAQALSLILGSAVVVFYLLPVIAAFNAYIYEKVGPTAPPEPKTS